MNKNIVIATVVVLVLIVGGWFLTRPKQIMAPEVTTQDTQTTVSTQSAVATGEAMMEETKMVSIIAAGFSPKDLTVKVGETITWTNADSANHTVSSDNHPVHTLFPFLNVGKIMPQEKKMVTFEKAGKYTYHDHLNPSLTGSITVE